jgi:glutamate/aspartate transport system substrate-binding protein
MKSCISHGSSLVAACLIGLPIFVNAAQAEDLTGTLKKIKDSGAITLGTRESSVPFSYLDAQHNSVGYSVDLCLRVVERVKQTLGLPVLEVHYVTVAPAARKARMARRP